MFQYPQILKRVTKQQRILAVIAIAGAFFILEIAIGIKTRSLALVADAFHIFSDLLGYMVAYWAVKLNIDDTSNKTKYTYGYQRSELLGSFFNGAFLLALGVSVLLQSIERFTEPSGISDPILVMAVGAAGIGSNVLMAAILGGHHAHTHSSPTDAGGEDDSRSDQHRGHAHERQHSSSKKHGIDLNILGIFVHILGDAVNSIAVIISGGIYLATKFIYADPIVSTFVGIMIISTAIPLSWRSGQFLMNGAPRNIDTLGVREDIERITGKNTVHELHIWNITQNKSVASLHVAVSEDSVLGFMDIARKVKQCLHLWNIHIATIQPELVSATGMDMQQVENLENAEDRIQDLGDAHFSVYCWLKCERVCDEDVCCEPRKTK